MAKNTYDSLAVFTKEFIVNSSKRERNQRIGDFLEKAFARVLPSSSPIPHHREEAKMSFPHRSPQEKPFKRRPREPDLWPLRWDGSELWQGREILFPGPFKSQLLSLSVYLQLNIRTTGQNVSALQLFSLIQKIWRFVLDVALTSSSFRFNCHR